MAAFLQRSLNKLIVSDPFQIKNYQELMTVLQDPDVCGCEVFSLDLQDLYYSIPQQELCRAVHKCIEANDAVGFQTECGVSVASFLELLRLNSNHSLLCSG